MKIKKIDGNNYKRVFVVGDLHGCYSLLMSELNEIGFSKETDLLLSVGDLIDRGQENLECMELIDESWFECVKGNHEDMAYRAVMGDDRYMHCWLSNGGAWYDVLNDEHNFYIKRFGDLPNFIELDYLGGKFLIGHADYPNNEYSFESDFDVEKSMWSRDRVNSEDMTIISGVDQVILGHTPMNKSSSMGNRIYIDTGAVFCGNMTIIELQGEL